MSTKTHQSKRTGEPIPTATERRSGVSRATGTKPIASRNRFFSSITEVDYTNDEIEFMKALDAFKRDQRKPFPTCSEVLDVLLALGYRKPPK